MKPKNYMNKQYTIGVDIGGTNIKAVLYDGKNVLAKDVLATPKDNLEHLLVMIQALLNPFFEQVKQNKIKKIGLSVAGFIDFKNQKVIKSPNIPILDDVFLCEKIQDIFNIETQIDNDANCFLLAEAKRGVAKKHSNIFGISIGTGIGGAWYLDDKIYKSSETGMEFGHLLMDVEKKIDLEQIYHKLTQNSPLNLAREAYLGDVLAERAYEEFGENLGVALVNVVNLLGPDLVVIGGSATESSDLFFAKIKKIMQDYALTDSLKKIKIVKSALGEYAGAIGGALLA